MQYVDNIEPVWEIPLSPVCDALDWWDDILKLKQAPDPKQLFMSCQIILLTLKVEYCGTT